MFKYLKKSFFRATVGFFLFFYCVNMCHADARKEGSKVLENTPIDVVYTYVDLTDKNLVREGMPRISKEYENEELKFSLRSVLQNIPWVRKIFIIMPNEKVAFLKATEEIDNRIVYIKDKDLLGFDCASSITFEQNGLAELDKFGVSEHFIYMNDDYFIGSPLQKSDFFYEKDGIVKPYVLIDKNLLSNNMFGEINRKYHEMKKSINTNKCKHSGTEYFYQHLLAYKLIYKALGRRDLILPQTLWKALHNASPYTISDMKKLKQMVKDNYKYADECLYSVFRTNRQPTHQILHDFYFLNKENRQTKSLDCKFCEINYIYDGVFKSQLFCINTSNREYSEIDYIKSRLILNKIFPRRTVYEKPELENGVYSIVSKLNEDKVIDIQGASKVDFAPAQLYGKNNTSAQKFRITYDGNGYYLIKAVCSGKMLDVEYAGKAPGTRVVQYGFNDTDAQKWYIFSDRKSSYFIISKCNDLFLDVEGANTDNGTKIQCYGGNGTLAQKFKLLS